MSDKIDEYVYTTIESVLKWADKVESRSCMTCANIRQLDKNATYIDYLKALSDDRAFFYGYINEIETCL